MDNKYNKMKMEELKIKIKGIVERYAKSNRTPYFSDIIIILQVDPCQIHDAINELEKEGWLKYKW